MASTAVKDLNAIKVTGSCDAGCGKPAKIWFGMTSMAHCGLDKCNAAIQLRYEEHCRQIDEQYKNKEDY